MTKFFDIKNFFLYFSPAIVVLVAGMVTFSVYSKSISSEHYGIVANLVVYFSILYALFSYGLSIVGQKIIYVDEECYRERLGNLVIFFVLNFLFVIVIVFLFRKIINRFLFDDKVSLYILMLGPIQVFLSSIKNIPLEIYRSQKKAGIYAGLTIAFTLIEPIVMLYYVLFKKITFLNIIDIKYIAFGAASILFFLCAVKNVTMKFNLKDLISNLKIGLPNVPAFLSRWIVKGSDRIFLINFYNLSAVGVYSANIKIDRILTSLLVALNNTLFPDLIKDAKGENTNSNIFKMAIIIFAAFSLGALFFGKEFVLLFSKKEYFQSSLLFALIAIYSYFFFVQHVFWPYIIIENKINYAALIRFICSFLTIAANYFLIKHLSYIGAVWATLASHLFIVIFLYIAIRKKKSIIPIMLNLLIFIIATVFVLFFQSPVQALSYTEIAVKFFAYLLSVFLLFALNRVNPIASFFKTVSGKD